MDKLIEIEFIKPIIPEEWNYDESVNKVKAFVYKWKNLTEDIAQELWIARELLSGVGNPNWNKSSNSQTWTQYCEDIGSSRQVVNRWLQQWFEPKELPHVAQASGENEWYTPSDYIESARQMMGSIDVDPASSEEANKIVGAKEFYTIQNNGLDENWKGNVWMNPPYSQPLIAQFCNILVEKYKNKEINQACVLVNNATETTFFQNMLSVCLAICFIKGRIKFIDKEGKPSGAPLQGQAILYFGENLDDFVKEFKKHGIIMRRYD